MQIIRLTPGHASEYRALMLGAFSSSSGEFTSTIPDREGLPLEWWRSRVTDDPDAPGMVFGAFTDHRLVGVAGIRFGRRQRTRHKATFFGLFVLPEFQGRGIARTLVETVLEKARTTPGVRVVQLTVTETNPAAIRLYESCGFKPWGVEPLAISVDECFVPKVHMWHQIRQQPACR